MIKYNLIIYGDDEEGVGKTARREAAVGASCRYVSETVASEPEGRTDENPSRTLTKAQRQCEGVDRPRRAAASSAI